MTWDGVFRGPPETSHLEPNLEVERGALVARGAEEVERDRRVDAAGDEDGDSEGRALGLAPARGREHECGLLTSN